MKRFWSSFFIALVVIIAGFFITSVSMASFHNQTIVDEWRSWLPAQEKVVDEEISDDEISTEVEDYVIVENS